jgi:multidomain signaling protein FimX
MTPKPAADAAINLLVVNPSPNETEGFATALRNAGIAVHARRVDNPDALTEALQSGRGDLALYCAATPGLGLEVAIERFRLAPELPWIALFHQADENALVRALRGGARDGVRQGAVAHLQLAVRREIETLRLARRCAALERRLGEAEDRNTTLMETSRQAIAYVHEGMHVRANPAYLQLFGYVDISDVEGMPLLDMVAPADHGALKKLLRGIDGAAERTPQRLELSCQGSDGATFPALLELSAASIDGEPCTQVVVSEQRDARELEQKLRQLSTRDPQTGLANRTAFLDRLAELASGREDGSVLYIDLDRWSELHKNLGLTVGDALFQEIAQVLSAGVDSRDTLARFADHAFTLFTREIRREQLEALAQQLCRAVEGHTYQAVQQFVAPTCSIGIVRVAELLEYDPKDLVNRAYQASELAAQQGGNRVLGYEQVAAAAVNAAVNERGGIDLGEAIRYAVQQERFRLVYQPIVSLQGDTRENYAVLVRLLDPQNQEILPGRFLKQAEESGDLPAVDRWVVHHAIAELARQRAAGKKIFFFVSISGLSVESKELLLNICELLEQYQVKGSWLTFQLSERDLRTHVQAARPFVDELKKLGCQFAIDQFGLLPKPDGLLKHFPVDFVRLDRSFMDGLNKNPKKQNELHALNELATTYHIKTVTTGVEDAITLALLWNIGVNYIQGYFLQEPSETIDYDFSHS